MGYSISPDLTSYSAINRYLYTGSNNTISNPSATNYKVVTGINISDGSTRGTITGSRITIFSGLSNMNVHGDNITVGEWMRSMVIMGNDITASNGSLVSNAGEGVLIGNLVSSNNWKQTCIGWSSRCEGVADTAIGWAADCRGTTGQHKIAFGRAATVITAGGAVLGSHTNDEWWFGNGEVHKFVNLNGTLENVVPSTRTITLHVGPDALDVQDTPDAFNINGGNGRLAPGVPTGTGTRAKLFFAQADGVNLGQNTKQALQNVGYVDTTGDLVWWDLMRINKISATASCIVDATVTSGNIATDYSLKISNGATSVNSPSGTTLLLKIANATRFTCSANTNTTAVPLLVDQASAPTVGANQAGVYAADIVAGNTAPHFKTENGQIIKLYTANAGSAYAITNGTTDRTYNANATTVEELADALYTLIEDLKLTGIIV